MIRYSLVCEAGHDFESWFRDAEGYETQARAGFVTCPVCGTAKVTKALMAPAVRTSKKASPDKMLPTPTEEKLPVVTGQDKAMREVLRALHEHVRKTTADVGDRFAEEALKIHHGEAETRAIRGRASADEARRLIEEGVPFSPLPPLPDDAN
jgi:hypothetical protein